MSNAKHTPGPWFIRERLIIGEVASGYTICWVNDDDCDGIPAGDAALIAAAPEMLAALELAKQFGGENAMSAIDPDAWEAINAAISKAKGQA